MIRKVLLGVAVLLIGVQGTGKSTFGRLVAGLHGPELSVALSPLSLEDAAARNGPVRVDQSAQAARRRRPGRARRAATPFSSLDGPTTLAAARVSLHALATATPMPAHSLMPASLGASPMASTRSRATPKRSARNCTPMALSTWG